MIQERLKELRNAKKMTQVELARRVGISKHLYNKYERNNVRPSDETLSLLAKELGVTFEYLALGTEQKADAQKEKADPNHEPTNKEEKRLIEAFRAVKSEKIKQAVIDILEDSANPATKNIKVKSNVEREYETEK